MENQKLKSFIEAENKKDRAYKVRMKKRNDESNKISLLREEFIYENLSKATAHDYIEWLKGYINNGNTPTHNYDYKIKNQDFYIAYSDFTLDINLCGSHSLNIILAKGVNANIKQYGHCNFFYMDDFKCSSIVPVFTNTIF